MVCDNGHAAGSPRVAHGWAWLVRERNRLYFT